MSSNLVKRSVTGILFVVVMVGCILAGPIPFAVLFALITALAVREFSSLANAYGGVRVNVPITSLGGAYLFLGAMACCTLASDARVFLPYVALLLYLLVSELYLKRKDPVGNWAYTVLSQVYVAMPFSLLCMRAFRVDPAASSVVYEPLLPLSVFVFLWLSDTGAYCVGSLLGRHRLFERISPKKSWEGSIGGAVFAVAASLVFARFCPFMSWGQWVGLSVVVVVFGTWGDLTESLLKRHYGIKDSGNILPGHGGLLDRFDSSLMAIPAAAVYLLAFDLY